MTEREIGLDVVPERVADTIRRRLDGIIREVEEIRYDDDAHDGDGDREDSEDREDGEDDDDDDS